MSLVAADQGGLDSLAANLVAHGMRIGAIWPPAWVRILEMHFVVGSQVSVRPPDPPPRR